MSKLEIYKRVLPSVPSIVVRNVFLLVNAVIFVVVVLLFSFGAPQAGIFLGIVFFLNTGIAIAQDIHAKIILEELQMLTVLKVVRLNTDKTETLIPAEQILKSDLIKLKLGDQMPCEGKLVSGNNLEISEALVTGESDSFPKKDGDTIIAGAIITSGSGIIEAQNTFQESRLHVIEEDVKTYIASSSSIERAMSLVIKYSGFILIFTLLFVITRGILLHIPELEIVTNAGALASTLVPQGLVVVVTLLFAIGADSYARRHVLFQEINATEKLGRIKNICIDKTGTLTDNILAVESANIFDGLNREDIFSLSYESIVGMGDSSQTVIAVKKYLKESIIEENKEEIKIIKALSFSSWRRYGAVEVEVGGILQTIFVGSPDVFLSRITNVDEKKWLESVVGDKTKAGNRVLCVVSSPGAQLSKDIKDVELSPVALFVFSNNLRVGIVDAIKFFQNRGVRMRVLSGDSSDTVQSVARSVGIKGVEDMVTGLEMSKWSNADFENKAHKYTVFAEVLPEHKVKLVEVFKKDGFTAMVGDGVNDALAMKKADLGIAMFDGVPITRQLAGVILMTNSFSDLPGAVELADHFIRSIEISSGIYINQSLMGLFFFILISIFGYSYPLVPLNITFINYFTVGLPVILISYWALRPSGKIMPANDKPFLKRVMPLVFYCAIVEAIGLTLVMLLGPQYLKTSPSNTLVGLAFILFGSLFLIFATKVYAGSITKKEKLQLIIFGIFEIILFFILLQIPILIHFFNITLPYPAIASVGQTLLVIFIAGIVQYLIIKRLFLQK